MDIELAGDVPLQDELKVGDLGTETYQYQVWAKINEKWSNVLFGDITDTLGVSGGCGFNTISCDNSQVDFSVIGNSVKITGPLILQITQFRIKTLYESGSMEEDDVIDDVEG
ncbi:hypothetical protein K8R47_04190 [archaeon]|nr:hypothetical protein [archaeon]